MARPVTGGTAEVASMKVGMNRHFYAKTKIEMEVAEEELEKALGAIEESAKGTVYGEGKVFVYFLDKTIELGKRARSVSRI